MFKGQKHTIVAKEKMRLAKLNNPTRFWFGKKRDAKTNEKNRIAHLGKPAWNKGLKGIMKPNKTSFKKGEHHGIEFGRGRRVDRENHYNWKGGKSFELYGTEFNKELKTKIRKRDEFVCQECGKNGFDIHHIDYDKKNNDSKNLITLCRKCHMKTNFEREDWKQYFQEKSQVIAAAETKRSNTETDR